MQAADAHYRSFQATPNPFQTPSFPFQTPSFPFQTPSFPFQSPSFPFQSPSFPFQSPSFPFQSPSFPFQSPSFPFQSPRKSATRGRWSRDPRAVVTRPAGAGRWLSRTLKRNCTTSDWQTLVLVCAEGRQTFIPFKKIVINLWHILIPAVDL